MFWSKSTVRGVNFSGIDNNGLLYDIYFLTCWSPSKNWKNTTTSSSRGKELSFVVTWQELAAGEPSMMSYMIGGSSEPAPPRIENPKPHVSLRFSFTYFIESAIFPSASLGLRLLSTLLGGWLITLLEK